MLVPVLLFILGLILLIKGGDWFVDGSTDLARRFHVPELVIGATVVSIGTTLPEVLVSATGALSGHSEIAYGNAIGSVICNTALISAITFAVRPCKVEARTFRTPVIFFFAAAVFYALNAYIDRYFTRLSGIALLLLFAAYIAYTIWSGKRHGFGVEDQSENTEDNPLWKTMLMLVVGAAAIAIGARLLVDNGTLIAEWLGVPESVIALTFVALGTSLPELVTAITALRKGHSALSLGNIVGANLFNLVLVSGLSTALCPFAVPTGYPGDVLCHAVYDPARAETPEADPAPGHHPAVCLCGLLHLPVCQIIIDRPIPACRRQAVFHARKEGRI